MKKTLRVLNVEDSPRDVALLRRHLSLAGYHIISERVETAEAMRAALETQEFDVILCDYSMPHFNALSALALMQEMQLEIPFIIISGTIGEELAVEAMRAGAHDYLMKDHLARLVPTIEREMQEAENRRARRRVEEQKAQLILQVERERQRLNNIVGSVPGVVWEAWGQPDAENQRIDFVSDYVETMLGYTVEAWLSTPNFWLTIVHPDDKEEAARVAGEAFASGKSRPQEFRWLAKDGRAIWVESNYAVIMDDEGRVVGLRGVTTDITERKRAEDQLRQARDFSENLIQTANVIILGLDVDGNVGIFNQTAEKITGYTADELKGTSWFEKLVPKGRYPYVWEEFKRLIDGSVPKTFENPILTKSGEERHIMWQNNQVKVNGKVVATISFGIDVTESKAAESELARLAAAVEQTADSIMITDIDGKIEYVNPAFERITGYSKKEVLGENPRILKSERTEPATYRELWETITRGDVWVGHLLNRKKDGTLFNEWATISAVYDESGKVVNYIAVKQDTTAQVQLEEQLRQSQKLEAIGQLAGGIAHDFNNLLTVITGYSDLTLMRLGKEDRMRMNVEQIKKAGERAASLTRQLLAFSRKQVLQPIVLKLNAVVADIEKMLRRLIGEDIDLFTVLEPSLGDIKADPGQIEQVILNLAVNARDAMPQGGKLTIETSNIYLDNEYAGRHVAIRPGNYVMLAVSDTGTGMDADTQAHIFEPFFTTKGQEKGTGLGLSTVYGIVKQSGGNIWVYSEIGRGTTFKVYLPTVNDVPLMDEAPEFLAELPRGRETVLLTEDEEPVRRLTRVILEMNGYRVLEAPSGDAALSLYEEHKGRIDLIITDVVMPKMSGRELAQSLESVSPGIKVLYVSGYTDDAIVRHGLLDQKMAFLQKPFTPDALLRKVREVLDETR